MMPGHPRIARMTTMAAVTMRTAAIVLACAGASLPARGDDTAARALAIELQVALGDLRRLDTPDLPTAHAEGLRERLAGSLGLLPWLLLRAGHGGDAEALAGWASRPLDAEARRRLRPVLDDLAAAVPFALAARADLPQPPAALAEAAALHETYCAGCHDGAGAGDPDARLPARDLRRMAREETAAEFLARLAAGIKGDETIAFRTPVTDRQILALRAYYLRSEPE